MAKKLAKEQLKKQAAEEKEAKQRENAAAKLVKAAEKQRLTEEKRLAKEAKKIAGSKKKNTLRRDASDLTYYSDDSDENDENDANAANILAQGEKRNRNAIDYSKMDSRGMEGLKKKKTGMW